MSVGDGVRDVIWPPFRIMPLAVPMPCFFILFFYLFLGACYLVKDGDTDTGGSFFHAECVAALSRPVQK